MEITFQKCIFVSGLLTLICGVILLFIGEPIRNHVINSQFSLSADSNLFKSWKETPIPLPQDFYFFNWTNPEDIYNETIKPKFEQVGPYRYEQIFRKEDIQWNNNGTVTFRQNKFWFFKNGTLSDEINLVNPVILSTAHAARLWGYIARRGMSLSLSALTSTVYIRRSIQQLLFDGYPDPILQIASSMPILSRGFEDMDRFGLLYKKNGSAAFNGVFNIGTGDKTNFGKLYQWNYNDRIQFYNDQCSEIHECLGDFFDRNLSKTKIRFFSADMCRVLTLDYIGEEVVENVLGYKYAMGGFALDNGTKYPESSCFAGEEGFPAGVMNISECRFGAPFFISLPHFHNGDPYYTTSVEGVNPDIRKHGFSMVIEPITGVPLLIEAKLQVNMLVQPISGIRLFQDIPRKYFMPLMWNEYKVKIPSDKAAGVKFLVDLPQLIMYLGIGLITISLVLLIIGLAKLYWKRKCYNEKANILQEQNVPLRPKIFKQ